MSRLPVLVLCGLNLFGPPISAEPAAARLTGAVSRIVDGDTFKLVGLTPSIRIWGLDAPETDQDGGTEATRALRILIEQEVLMCHIRDIDRYGRIVGQCFLQDGRDIASAMIRQGVAEEYCRFSEGFYGTC